MYFNSLEYALFLPAVFAAYALTGKRIQNLILLLASYVFYGWWDPRFLFLITLSTAIDYCAGLFVANGRIAGRNMAKSAAYLIGSAAVFLGGDFSRLAPGAADFDPGGFLDPVACGKWVVATAVFLAAMAALYRVLLRLPDHRKPKAGVAVSVSLNLFILCVFKYFDFFVGSIESSIAALGGNPELYRLNVILPVGISFYTFQTISYSIDIYRGKCKPTRNFLDFALFVSYFPQLVAGPIERASRLLPSLLAKREITVGGISRGLYLILFGLFKKVAIADGLAPYVDAVYGGSATPSNGTIVLGTVAFALQIYCDFSGYSDIARGTSKLFGIELMTNFRLPYFSSNPSEFWRRWHISLSSWLRDYLYIPLGGSRGSRGMTYRNLMITMGLGGLWHGAAWNFVLWGVYQGAILSVHRAWAGDSRDTTTGVVKLVKIGFFFVVTCYGWLLFRAESFEQIRSFTLALFQMPAIPSLTIGKPGLSALVGLPILGVMEIHQYWHNDPQHYRRLPAPALGAVLACLIVAVLIGMNNEPAAFVYFQF